MRSSHLSTISNFGKFFPKQQKNTPSQQSIHSIELKQNFTHERPFTSCKFDIQGNKLYLQDSVGTLISLNLSDNNISTLKQQKIIDFAIDGQNNFTILLVNKNSQLCKVNFENKKSQKIMNLNMSKILAFQRNYLRQMILVLDYKLLFLCDLTNPSKIKSLKASSNQTFTNACFGSNNRFLILAVKNIQIRVLEILNLKTIHKICLPFQVQNLKIQVSFDNRKIAIYGDCHIIFFISFNENLQPSYQLVQLPQIKIIKQLKYTYENEIVLLANDQVIYAISPDDSSRLVAIFNQQDHIRLMGFDLSIDTKSMAIVSNRTVFTVHWKNGLRNFIRNCQSFKQIQFVKNVSEKQSKQKENLQQNKKYQYQEEEDSSDQHQKAKNILNYANTAKIQDSIQESYLQEIKQLKQSKKGKAHLQQIYTNLLTGNQNSNQLINQNKLQVLQLMKQTYELNSQDPYQTLAICDKLMKGINQETQNAQKFSLILIPQVQSVIQKRFKLNFKEWFMKNMCKLFVDYLQHQEWTKLVNWILYNQTKTAYISLFFVVLLQELYKTIQMSQNQNWQILLGTTDYKLELDVRILFERVQKMYSSQQYEYIFAKGLRQKLETSNQNVNNSENVITFGKNQKKQSLQQLLAKQEQIKRALSALHGSK